MKLLEVVRGSFQTAREGKFVREVSERMQQCGRELIELIESEADLKPQIEKRNRMHSLW